LPAIRWMGLADHHLTSNGEITMLHRVTRIPVHPFAKIVAVVTAASSLIFVVPMALVMFAVPSDSNDRFMLFALPVFPLIYLVVGYIWAAFSAWVYNMVAGALGGVEVEMMVVE
jgi:hypothetical protein